MSTPISCTDYVPVFEEIWKDQRKNAGVALGVCLGVFALSMFVWFFSKARANRLWNDVTIAMSQTFKFDTARQRRIIKTLEWVAIIMEFWQLSAYSFVPSIPWPDIVRKIFWYLSLGFIQLAFLVSFWILVGLYLLAMFVLLVSWCVRKSGKFKDESRMFKPESFLKEYGPDVYLDWLYMPTLNACLNMMACSYGQRFEEDDQVCNVPVVWQDRDLRCWEGNHVAYVIFAVYIVLVLYPGGLWTALTVNEGSPDFYFLPRFAVCVKAVELVVAALAAFVSPWSPLGFLIILGSMCFMFCALSYYYQPYLGRSDNHKFGNARTASYAGATFASIIAITIVVRDDVDNHLGLVIYLSAIVPVLVIAFLINRHRAKSFTIGQQMTNVALSPFKSISRAFSRR